MADPHDPPHADAPQRVAELVANLDDVTGEQVGQAIDTLMRRGALDAWATPITMKKGRPAVMLSVLTSEDQRDEIAELMLHLTGSFGVRYRPWDRVVLERAWHDRPTRLGSVRLKVGALGGRAVTVKPEADAVARLAKSSGVGLVEATRVAQGAADALLAELRAGVDAGLDTAEGGGS